MASMGEAISAASGGEGWVNHLSSRTFLGSILKPAQCEEFFRHIPAPEKTAPKSTTPWLPSGAPVQPSPGYGTYAPEHSPKPPFTPFRPLFRNSRHLPD